MVLFKPEYSRNRNQWRFGFLPDSFLIWMSLGQWIHERRLTGRERRKAWYHKG